MNTTPASNTGKFEPSTNADTYKARRLYYSSITTEPTAGTTDAEFGDIRLRVQGLSFGETRSLFHEESEKMIVALFNSLPTDRKMKLFDQIDQQFVNLFPSHGETALVILEGMRDFWKNGTPIHPGSILADQAEALLKQPRRRK